MTAKELYEVTGSDYKDVLSRLMNDALVGKFAIKFLEDKSFEQLKEAVAVNDVENAFRAAHTLKGVTANLSFSKLRESSSNMTEQLRPRKDIDRAMYEVVERDYEELVAKIKEFAN